MCGIVGVVISKSLDNSILIEMTDSIKHRGPDNSSTYINKIDNISFGLGHRRLSIIDLESRSNQPFFNQSKNISLIYNGEIYNYKELIEDLKHIYNFRTQSDTEVILALYELYGMTFVDRLIGIFSFSITDLRTNITYLVRDRHGVKPLYYYMDSNSLVYSSELRPIMKYPFFNKTLNLQAVESMLSLKFIPAPMTIFENVYKVEPGTILEFKNLTLINKFIYWDTIQKFILNRQINVSPNLDIVLFDAVKRNMVADTGVAAFLSGGLDSSLICALANRINSDITSYSVGFENPLFDESKKALSVSNFLGLNNKLLTLNVTSMLDVALDIASIVDEPFGDSSIIPTYIMSKEVAKDGYKVVLSGDGEDEFFYGYNSYDYSSKYSKIHKLISPIIKLISPILDPFTKYKLFYGIRAMKNLSSFYFARYAGYAGLLSKKTLIGNHSIYKDKIFSFLELIKDLNPIEINSIFDQKIYMIDDVLVKVDRASMAASLESRVPLLDHTVSEASYNFSLSDHYSVNNKKKLLNKVLTNYLDKSLIDREKKGFSVPVIQLLLNDEIRIKIESFSNKDFITTQKIFRFGQIQNILRDFYEKDNTKAYEFIWNYYVFQSWYVRYIYEQ